MNPAAQPSRLRGHRPHMKASNAGARPKETTSASESSCTPNAVEDLVSRATKPSSVSSTIVMPMKSAAVSKSPWVEYTTHAYPQKRFATVNIDGSRNTPRRKRPGRSSRRRRSGRLLSTLATEHGEHRHAADHPLAYVRLEDSGPRQEDIHARSELHQADPLAAFDVLALTDAADDPPRQDADHLTNDDRL